MRARSTITDTAKIVPLTGFNAPISVAAYPGSGCTMSVEISLTENAAGDPANAKWIAWSKGTVSEDSLEVLLGPVTALRFTRVSGTNSCSADIVSP